MAHLKEPCLTMNKSNAKLVTFPIGLTTKILTFLFTLIFLQTTLAAQNKLPGVELLTWGTKTSLRGLSVVNDNVVWVSGSNGTVGKTRTPEKIGNGLQ